MQTKTVSIILVFDLLEHSWFYWDKRIIMINFHNLLKLFFVVSDSYIYRLYSRKPFFLFLFIRWFSLFISIAFLLRILTFVLLMKESAKTISLVLGFFLWEIRLCFNVDDNTFVSSLMAP